MMIAEGNQQRQNHQNVPPWSFFDDSTTDMGYDLTVGNGGSGGSSVFSGGGQYSPVLSGEALTALKRYLPSNDIESDSDISDSCDEFRMYEFKIRRCVGGRSHDWTDCPYAHPGEKARRRDPRIFHYSGTPCPDFRKGNCKRGDTCEYAHGVFECWLHPSRYRTQPCKDGINCRRRICFFAHTSDQLRVLPKRSPKSVTESPPSYDGSPLRQAFDTCLSNGVSMLHSPTSTLISPPISPPDSPLMAHNSPILTRSIGSNSVNEVILSLRNLQLNKIKSGPSSWGVPISSGFFSPRGSSTLRPDFSSLPSTPTRTPSTRSGIGYLDFWDRCDPPEEEPAMEVVESGRNLRSKIYEKLSKENSLDRVESVTPVPDVEWIFELVK